MEQILKILTHPDGKRRVLILRRESGVLGFEEEYWSELPLELCWCHQSQGSFGLLESVDTAEREARGRITWLATLQTEHKRSGRVLNSTSARRPRTVSAPS